MGSQPRFHGLGDVLRDEGEGMALVAYFRWHTDSCFQRKADRHSCWSEICPACTVVHERGVGGKRTMLKIPVGAPDWSRSWLDDTWSSDGQKSFLWQSFLQEVTRRWQNIQAPQHCLLVKSCREFVASSQAFNQGFILRGISAFLSVWECSTSITMSYSGPFCQFRVIRHHSVLGISSRAEIIDVSWTSCLLEEDMSKGQQLGMRVCLLQVYFSHDLHTPSYPRVKEKCWFSFLVFVSVADCS